MSALLATGDWVTVLVVNGIILVGALVQALTGVAPGLMIVPLIALVDLAFIPGPFLLASVALNGVVTFNGRRYLKLHGIAPLMTGVILGSVIGALLLAALPVSALRLYFGVTILLAIALSLSGLKPRWTPPQLFGVGMLSGFMGTVAAAGGAVLALIYQHEKGPTLRATLALLYLASTFVMMGILHLAGKMTLREVQLGLAIVPGFVLGYLMSRRFVHYLDVGHSRNLVLAVAALSACTLIATHFKSP